MTPPNVLAARSVLAGRVPLTVLGIEIAPEDISNAFDWPDFMFTPEEEIVRFSHPERRTILRRGCATSLDAEKEIQAEHLSPLGAGLVASMLAEAMGEALQMLGEAATEGLSLNARLNARVCVAARAELAALLREWEEVTMP